MAIQELELRYNQSESKSFVTLQERYIKIRTDVERGRCPDDKLFALIQRGIWKSPSGNIEIFWDIQIISQFGASK